MAIRHLDRRVYLVGLKAPVRPQVCLRGRSIESYPFITGIKATREDLRSRGASAASALEAEDLSPPSQLLQHWCGEDKLRVQ